MLTSKFLSFAFLQRKELFLGNHYFFNTKREKREDKTNPEIIPSLAFGLPSNDPIYLDQKRKHLVCKIPCAASSDVLHASVRREGEGQLPLGLQALHHLWPSLLP